MKTYIIFIFSLMTFLGSCIETLDRNLGNNYFLSGYGETTAIYKHNTKYGDQEISLGKIVDYKFDDNYILVYRVISEEVKNYLNGHYLSEIMRGGGNIQYWIIQKNNNIIAGPFSKVEYLSKRIELNVSSKLHLSGE